MLCCGRGAASQLELCQAEEMQHYCLSMKWPISSGKFQNRLSSYLIPTHWLYTPSKSINILSTLFKYMLSTHKEIEARVFARQPGLSHTSKEKCKKINCQVMSFSYWLQHTQVGTTWLVAPCPDSCDLFKLFTCTNNIPELHRTQPWPPLG